MLNLKKILIVILVLFLILVVRKTNILENFFDERYLNSTKKQLDRRGKIGLFKGHCK